MKAITFIVGNYKNGGVPMHATNLANEFGKRGYKVTILVTKEIAEKVFFELHENVQLVSLKSFFEDNKERLEICEELKKQSRKIRRLKRIRYFSKVWTEMDKNLEYRIRCIRRSSLLRCYLLLNQDSILIPFGPAYYEQAYYASKGLDFKILYAERNAPELEVPKDKEKASRLLEILNKADGAVFQTNDEKEFYQEYISKNTAVIYNPVKKGLPEPFAGERRKVIVNYCRIAGQKNLKLLIDAFSRLHKVYPEYTLEIYGNAVAASEEELREELKQYVAAKQLEDCIRILPPAADVHERVRDCAMFVSSSDFEGLSNSMIEAMAIGLPCVCTDCLGGGAREMIENEVNGLLVPMQDEEALYEGVKRMIEDSELAKKCGRNASKIVEEMSVEKVADKWLEIINKI